MTDPRIAEVARQQRAAAQQWLNWHLDNLRLHAGILEPLPDDEPDVPVRSRMRRRDMDEHARLPKQGEVRAIYCGRRGDGCPKYGHFHLVRPAPGAPRELL